MKEVTYTKQSIDEVVLEVVEYTKELEAENKKLKDILIDFVDVYEGNVEEGRHIYTIMHAKEVTKEKL